MFDAQGVLRQKITNSVTTTSANILVDLYLSAEDLINENNGSKHRVMADVYLIS